MRAEVQPAEVSDSSMARLRRTARPACGVTAAGVASTGMSSAVSAVTVTTTTAAVPAASPAVLGEGGSNQTQEGQYQRKGSPYKEGSLAAHGLSTPGD